MTRWTNDSQRLAWVKDSILALFNKDPSPKTIEEIHKTPYFIFGNHITRRALNELCQEKRLFRLRGKSNTFIYRLPDAEKDKWWLK